MNYSLLQELLFERRMSIPLLADKIGMSKRGLYASIENRTLTVVTLEKIAEALDVRVTTFFEDGNDILIKESTKELLRMERENEALLKRQAELYEIIGAKRSVLRSIYNLFKHIEISKDSISDVLLLIKESEHFEGDSKMKNQIIEKAKSRSKKHLDP